MISKISKKNMQKHSGCAPIGAHGRDRWLQRANQ